MPIIFYTAPLGGYGDLLFGLKAAADIQASLRQNGDKRQVLLVSTSQGAHDIRKVGGDKEFGLIVLSQEEYGSLKEEGLLPHDVDYCITGPVSTPREATIFLGVSSETPCLVLKEYDYSKENDYCPGMSIFSSRYPYPYLIGGFGAGSRGIFLTPELKVLDEKNKCVYGQEIGSFLPLGEKLFAEVSIAEIKSYRQTHELSVAYTQDSRKKGDAFYRFLFVHHTCYSASKKNQDIVAIGGDGLHKKECVESLLSRLEEDYSLVSFFNAQTGIEDILMCGPLREKKHYRVLWFPCVPHRTMIALMGFSGEVCGVTGDQSFGEALSANKLMVGEWHSHRKYCIDSFITLLRKYGSDDAERLSYVLSYGENFSELERLLKNKEIVKTYHDACRQIVARKEYNLSHSLCETVLKRLPKLELSSVLASDQIYEKMQQAIGEKDDDFLDLLLLLLPPAPPVLHNRFRIFSDNKISRDDQKKLSAIVLAEDEKFVALQKYLTEIKPIYLASAITYVLNVAAKNNQSRTVDYLCGHPQFKKNIHYEALIKAVDLAANKGHFEIGDQLLERAVDDALNSPKTDLLQGRTRLG